MNTKKSFEYRGKYFKTIKFNYELQRRTSK